MIRSPRAALVALIVLTALPFAAHAQSVNLSLTAGSSKTSLSRADCELATQEEIYTLAWTSTLLPTQLSGATEVLYVSKTSSCTENEFGDDSILRGVQNREVNASASGSYPAVNNTSEEERITPRALFDRVADNCGGDAGIESTVYLCIRVTPGGGTGTTTSSSVFASVAITLDSKPPATPINVSAVPLDTALRVSWEMPDDLLGATGYVVRVTPAGGDTIETTVAGSGTRSTTVNDLANGTAYTVTVRSTDSSGTESDRNNESADSAPVTGTPQPVLDFYELYRDSGGTETGGCSHAPLAALALLGLLARRKRSTTLVALAMGTWLSSSLASADDAAPLVTQSPRLYTLSLRTGPYSPNIDEEPGLVSNGRTPYTDVFGTSTPLLWRLQFDVDFFEKFGRASLGLSGGFWQAVGKGKFVSGGGTSEQTVLLNLFPVTPVLTYRADFIWERWHVPLVPFARIGWGFTWWESKKGDEPSSYGNDSGSGWAQGFEYGVGLQLVLDALETDKAASLDQDFGINSTSLFFSVDGAQWKGAHGLLLHGTSFNGGFQLSF